MKHRNKLDRVLYVLGFGYIVAFQYGYVKGYSTASEDFEKIDRTLARRGRRRYG